MSDSTQPLKANKVTKRKISSDDHEDCSDDCPCGSDAEEAVFYEEKSESEPEIDCDNWDIDCKIVNLKSTSLTGYHLMPTCSRDPELMSPTKKTRISPQMCSELQETIFIQQFQEKWNNNSEFKCSSSELIVNPFKVCVFNNFLRNPDFLNKIRQEFYEIHWNKRNMDLYEFFQSEDLKHLAEFDNISLIYEFLQKEVMKWVSELTGFDLTHISATCSYYSNTDYLLVHDDQREDRMVAFVLYFTGIQEWTEAKGGALQLLDKDFNGHPLKPVRDIYPKNNQLVIFPVTSDSYHQVAEVICLSDCRFSINGWFHVKTPPVFQTPAFEAYTESIYSNKNILKPIKFDIHLDAWLTEEYLECGLIKQIQNYFEQNSEICLKNFMQFQSFNEIHQILYSDTLNFIKIGPPNRYNYEIVALNDLPLSLDRFLKLFQSEQFFEFLKRCTDLELTSLKYELQRWTPGCYSLLTDYDWQAKKELDLVLYFGCKDDKDVIGARTQYVSADEEEIQNALITLAPEENDLNIVYRDTARFTKYYSKLSKNRCYYTLICSYSE